MGVCHLLLILQSFLHLWISQISLTFSRNHLMHSVFCIVICVEVACKWPFLIPQHSTGQERAVVSDYWITKSTALDLYFIAECAIIIYIPFSWISQFCCCSIDLELIPQGMVNLDVQFLGPSIKEVVQSLSTYRQNGVTVEIS